jgi:hypothetical protein
MLFFLFNFNFSQVLKIIDGNMGINVVINKKNSSCVKGMFCFWLSKQLFHCAPYGQICNKCTHETFIMKDSTMD